jgi:hypothetical protein
VLLAYSHTEILILYSLVYVCLSRDETVLTELPVNGASPRSTSASTVASPAASTVASTTTSTVASPAASTVLVPDKESEVTPLLQKSAVPANTLPSHEIDHLPESVKLATPTADDTVETIAHYMNNCPSLTTEEAFIAVAAGRAAAGESAALARPTADDTVETWGHYMENCPTLYGTKEETERIRNLHPVGNRPLDCSPRVVKPTQKRHYKVDPNEREVDYTVVAVVAVSFVFHYDCEILPIILFFLLSITDFRDQHRRSAYPCCWWWS